MANPTDRAAVLDIIERQADRSNIPREDFLRFAYIETGGKFNANAHNTDSGAKGLFQFIPGTAKAYGLAGREFDPEANTAAAASLYEGNRRQIVARHDQTGRPFLSGAENPNGLDMYLAHQQGAAGYGSIQSAIATGNFSLGSTRGNIMGNISSRDFEQITGHPYSTVRGMDDRELATSFTQYWNTKYSAISIPDRGITASAALPGQRDALADGVLQRGERGNDVRALQESLNQLGFRDAQGGSLETNSAIYGQRTAEAVRSFQQANGLEPTGKADERTREALTAQQGRPAAERNQPAEPQARANGGATWPAPGNDQINRADKPREGHGEFGTARSGGRTHGGIDIQGNVGDPIVAFAGGKVTVSPNNGAAGNTVRITHDDGSVTKYFHLRDFSVRNGERVEAGEQIGTMGRSGNTPAKGDTHLHFELWRDGRKIDPLPELRAAERGGDGARPAPASSGVLRSGANGAEVKALQEQLNQLGYKGADGKPLETRSGTFGPQTEHALRSFQQDRGIGVDGAFGKQSREAMTQQLRAGGASTHGQQEGGEGQSSFVDRMLNAARNADVSGIQKTIEDYASTLKSQWDKQVQQNQQVQQATPDAAKPSTDPQR
ncbi:peptidoglycan-binding protein [Stenotrophomonas sp.]|uniref:peptidoglycan-binding protein n=1 Tax=Stenotrophomonas sp. TaxID=69392 RepID=UPI0028AF5F1D|nr:peptidoglycan-binding protein [Stenotrophomonas sp.]